MDGRNAGGVTALTGSATRPRTSASSPRQSPTAPRRRCRRTSDGRLAGRGPPVRLCRRARTELRVAPTDRHQPFAAPDRVYLYQNSLSFLIRAEDLSYIRAELFLYMRAESKGETTDPSEKRLDPETRKGLLFRLLRTAIAAAIIALSFVLVILVGVLPPFPADPGTVVNLSGMGGSRSVPAPLFSIGEGLRRNGGPTSGGERSSTRAPPSRS